MSKFDETAHAYVIVPRAEYDDMMATVAIGRDSRDQAVVRLADEIFRAASGWTSGGLSRLQTNADPYCRCGRLKADESPGCTWHAARARAEVAGQLELPLDWD